MKSPVRSTTQLAKILGLSRWTISRALNGYPGINKKTVELIQKTAHEHGFSPSLLGRGLRSGKTNLIGICLPDLEDYFLTNKISRLQEAIESKGFSPMIQMTSEVEERETHALGNFSAMHCAGVVCIASRLKANSPALRALTSSNIPVVMIDPMYPDHPNAIASDRHRAMKDAVKYYQSLGFRRMAVFGINNQSAGYGMQRIEGLKAACKGKSSWKFERDLVFLNLSDANNDFEKGALLAEQYLKLSNPPSCILCLNDRIAMGASQVLQSKGIKIPRDVSIIGYDNAEFSAYIAPSLTTFDPQVSKLIDIAVETLLSRPSKNSHAPKLIAPKLVIRDSTAKFSGKRSA